MNREAGRLRGLLADALRGERNIVSSLAGVGGLQIVSMLAGLLTTIVLGRLLGPASFGEYSVAYSLAALLALPLLQGLPVLVLREVSREAGVDRVRVARPLLRFSDRLIVSMGAAVGLLLAAAATVGYGGLRSGLALTALGVPLATVATLVRSSVVRAHGHALAGQVPDMLVRPLMLVALLLPLFWIGARTAEMAMRLHLVAALVAFAVAVAVYRPFSAPAADPATEKTASRAWLGSLLPLSTIAGMQLVNGQVGVALLGFLGSREEVGLYRLALTMAMQVSVALTVVNAVVAPKFARLHRVGRLDDLRRLNRWSALLSFAVGLPIFLAYALAGRPLIELAVGPAYLGAMAPLLLLSGAHLVTLWAGTTNVLLNMIGRERDVLVAAAVSAIANVALGALLIPRFGMMGAAWAAVVSLLAWRGLLSIYLRRRLRDEPSPVN